MNAPVGTVSRQTSDSTQSQAGVEIIQPYTQFLNRRAEPRFDCNNNGAMFLMPGEHLVSCQIVNQSASGAQVIFETIPAVPTEIWFIDVSSHTVKRGTAAWTMPCKMGLKFNFLQKLNPQAARPPKVPEVVFRAWRKLAGLDREIVVEIPPPKAQDVFFLD